MKKILLVSLSVLMIAGVSSASAQMGKKLTLGFGLSFLQNPDTFQDYWKRGIVGSGAIGFDLIPGLSLHGMLEYNSFPLDEEKIEELFSLVGVASNIDGADISVYSGFVMGKLRLLLAMPGTSPYAIGGVGFVSARIEDIKIGGGSLGDQTIEFDNETGPAVTLGLGFDLRFAPKIGLYGEVRYVRCFFDSDNLEYIPLKAGVMIDL